MHLPTTRFANACFTLGSAGLFAILMAATIWAAMASRV
jgi:hypothetical protein